jgi:hypothetical protein
MRAALTSVLAAVVLALGIAPSAQAAFGVQQFDFEFSNEASGTQT